MKNVLNRVFARLVLDFPEFFLKITKRTGSDGQAIEYRSINIDEQQLLNVAEGHDTLGLIGELASADF